MLQLFINGPPGAGKTSLCKLLCDEFGLELVATGDLLRENILQKTPLGVVAKDCITRKSLVPDHVVVDMVAEKIVDCLHPPQHHHTSSGRGNSGGWVLDGFPRTAEQSAALRRKQIYPSVVIVLELSEYECTKRITGRRFDPVTSTIYHMPHIMPRDASVLTRLTKRSDDAADKLPPRFAAYRQHGEATNALYESVLHRVDASRKTPQELLEEVVQLLHSMRRPHAAASGGGSSTAFSGNQSAQTAALAPPVIPIRHGHAVAGTTSPSSSTAGAIHKRQHHPHQMPQKIDEEDEEQVAQEAQGEFNYSDTEDPLQFTQRRGSTSTTPAASSPSSSPARRAPPPATALDDDERPGDFQAMHLDLGRDHHLDPTNTHPATSPSSKASGKAYLRPEETQTTSNGTTTTSRPLMFQSNNEETPRDGSVGASPPDSPASSPVGCHMAPPPTTAMQNAMSSVSGPSTGGGSVEMTKFRDLLLDGFDVLKHGRRGSPHARTIFTDMEFKRIFWMKPGKEAKAKKAKLDQSLLLSEVVHVLRGMKTEVLKRSGDVAKYERYLSLVADDRTLDLELPSEAMCAFLSRGFEQLVMGSS